MAALDTERRSLLKIIKRHTAKSPYEKSLKLRLKNKGGKNYRNYCLADIFSFLNILWLLIVSLLVLFLTRNFEFTGAVFLKIVIILTFFVLIALPYTIFIEKIFKYDVDKSLSKEHIPEITAPLRKRYKIGDEYVITKCYSSTEKDFAGKDVIVFLYKNEIRITADLFHSLKNIGCIVIPKDEAVISRHKEDALVCTVISCPGFEMLLAERAGWFLKKQV